MAYRRCSECGGDLAGKAPTAKTCKPKCRSARSRRIKRRQKEAGEGRAAGIEQRELAERVRGEAPDVAHQVIEEELRPVVRESITADTLKAIADMVALTPQGVAALQEDLASEDATVRQRAYTLLLKYTVGHQAIVTSADDKSGPMHVHFNLPRPEDGGDPPVEEVTAEVVELRECDTCHTEKPIDEFAANSYRCLNCYEVQRNRASELLHADD